MFAIEQPFGLAAEAFGTIFRQRLSVDPLEKVSRRMGEKSGEYLDALTPPPGDEEGDCWCSRRMAKGCR